jgi:hypothetical protein
MDRDIGPELDTIWSEAEEHIEHGEYDKAIEIYKYVLIRYGDSHIAVEYAPRDDLGRSQSDSEKGSRGYC